MSLADLRPGWMRQIIDASDAFRSMQPDNCVAHFFDFEIKRAVHKDLGRVVVHCKMTFRAAASAELSDLSWVEAAAQNDYLPDFASIFFDQGIQQTIDQLASERAPGAPPLLGGVSRYGFHVIPVQSPSEWTIQC